MKSLFSLVFWLCLAGIVQSLNNQCINYNITPRSSERSKDNSVLPANQSTLPCDNFDDGWYRFSSGEIATSCVPTHHCGTMSTIWMKDPVPKIGETRLNEFCVNHKISSPGNSCCLFSFKVNVTNCDGYMVYYFEKDSVLCPSGYCTGDLKPCLPGGSSTTGFQPCKSTYPGMESLPTLNSPVIINNGRDFSQTCDIDYRGSDPDAAFLVMWLFDDSIYKTVVLTNGTKSTSLTSVDWKGHIGQKLSCLAESYFFSQGPGNHSHILQSNDYFGGLQLMQRSVTVFEGSPSNLTIQSTLPIVCSNLSPDRCTLDLDVDITGSLPGGLLTDGGCFVTMMARNWDHVNGRVEVTTQLSTLIDPVLKPDQDYNINFSLRHDSPSVDLFNMQRSLDVNVTTRDEKHHTCIVVGESEILGFNRPTAYEMTAFGGDFLLYRNTGSSGRKLEVQTRTWRPIGRLSAVCGIAFQYGDTLIKVEMCNDDHDLAAPIMTQGESNPEDVQVFLCDSEYEIITGDGVRLSIIPRYLHLDMKLHLPPQYSNSGKGGCGYSMTPLRWNHFAVNLYSVKPFDSLFDQAGLPFYKVDSSPMKSTKKYCQCGGFNTTCSPFRRIRDPRAPVQFNSDGMQRSRSRCAVYVPRVLNPEYGSGESDAPLSVSSLARLQRQLMIPGFVTMQNDCYEKLKTYASPYCTSKYQSEIKEFVKICTYAQMASTLTQFEISGVQAFQWWCEEQALSEETSYTKDRTGHLIPPAELTSDLCPNLCSLHGACAHGTCSCHNETLGPDCLVSPNDQVPIILGVKGGQFCEMSTLHCGDPILVTRNLYPSDKLQAVLSLIELVNGQFHNTSSTFTLEPVYENHYSVSLPMSHTMASLQVQSAFGFFISLTVDGTTYSKPFKYIVYDDKCQACQAFTGVCYLQPNTCHINGKCYYPGEINPLDPSQICDPVRGVVRWSQVSPQTMNGTKPSATVQNPLIIG